MRKLFIAVLAATILTPVAASAQSAREVRQDRREVRQDRREIRQDLRRGDYREARKDRRELRKDRRELREDWRDYRRTHRNVYRRPAYVGPRGYRYRPVWVGYRFNPVFYSSRYWINDFWVYRLPRPAAGLRWIRYGNDVVLVNMRTGRVVQVHTAFFW
ncbi:MAG: RcnB family protein [Novosphingobium sp.]